MTITRNAMRAVHLGERLDEGIVTWSGNTRDKTLALITAKTTDAVGTFLNSSYVQDVVRELEKDAGHPVTDPQETVRVVGQAVDGMSGDTRAAARDLASQLILEDLSLLAEFDGDQIAIGKLLDAFRRGYTAEHVAERIRQGPRRGRRT
jgi:hypothetical protein